MTKGIPLKVDLKRIPSAWSSLTKERQQLLLNSSPLVAPLVSSLTWMRKWTKTQDDKDPETPYKPFPDWAYFDYLHKLLEEDSRLFVEKSRTMMATWWGA